MSGATIVGGALWLRPTSPEEIAVIEARLAERRRWMVQQERERLIDEANAAAEREDRARRWFAEQEEREAEESLPIFLRPQAG